MIRKIFVTAAFAIAALIWIPAGKMMVSAASMTVPRISAEQTREMLGRPDVVIIDVRSAKTWWKSTTKIVQAVRQDPGAVERWEGKYPKDKTLIFYCS